MNLEQNLKLSFSGAKTESKFKIESLLKDLLDKTYQNNKVVNSIISAKQISFWKFPADIIKQNIKFAIEDLTFRDSGHGKNTKLYLKG